MSAGPGWEPCTKRPRWGAAGTSAPTASDSRSFPGRQRRVLDPKDAPVQFRVPPSSPACVSGRAGPHRGNATSFGRPSESRRGSETFSNTLQRFVG
uniref:Poly (ADP-ribose) glycohydrolase n=1 Tax=Mus musculus TaxID=10090 RepID=E9Q3C4_MOUSE